MQLATTPEFRKALQGDIHTNREFYLHEMKLEKPACGCFKFFFNSRAHPTSHKIERMFFQLMVMEENADQTEVTQAYLGLIREIKFTY